jgi:hypothetical protein
MDGDGGADFALIDAEAERVAKEAVQRVRDSQKACFRARDGIPTFTGNIKVFKSYHLSTLIQTFHFKFKLIQSKT